MRLRTLVCALLLAAPCIARADGAADNLPDNVRRVPPPGIAVAEPVRAELQAGVEALGKKIESIRADYASDPTRIELLPDVEIFYNAVRYPLKYNEFYNPREFDVARRLLVIGNERADALRDGKSPW